MRSLLWGVLVFSLASAWCMRSHWNLSSGDGKISLALPANFLADLDVSTKDGRIESEFAGAITRRGDGSELRAKLNGGGNMLTVRTGDGNVKISRR